MKKKTDTREIPKPEDITQAVVMYSGGLGSWSAARRACEKYGKENVRLLFTDTKMEDEDLYRFLDDTVKDLGCEFVNIADGRDVWEVFFDKRFLGNSRIDPCSRILKRELARKWVEENCDQSNSVMVFGIDWSEEHRMEAIMANWDPWAVWAPMTEAPYVNKEKMKRQLRKAGIELPKLYKQGFMHNNCMQGDERFITSKGIKSFKETVGQEVRVLGRHGAWQDAVIQSFGVQQITRLHLRNKKREKVIETTADHRWFIRPGRSNNKKKEVLTKYLKCGDQLVSMYGRMESNVRPSPLGIMQGIVYGDGTMPTTQWNNPARVLLCGEKQDLLSWFPHQCPTGQVADHGTEVRDLPRFWNSLPPLNESKSFLYGWLAGYFAADGCVGEKGSVSISSSKRSNLEFVQDVATLIGIGVHPITSYDRKGYGEEETPLYTMRLVPTTLRSDFFLRSKHSERFEAMTDRRKEPSCWTVETVEETDRHEEVFCATVPNGHMFVLEHNVSTGNCGGFCVKQGQAGFRNLLLKNRERYLYHEGKEEEIREFLGKDVAILKERVNGESFPLTLKEFRRRVEEDGNDGDTLDWGGCGCFI